MARQKSLWVTFNRGIVSALGRARIDIERISFSAAEMTNWMCRVLGSMMLRPGMEFIGPSKGNARARSLSFTFSETDKARLEITPGFLRIWKDDALITRPAVSASVTNSSFTTDLTGWTDADESGGESTWVAGQLSLLGDGDNSARLRQQITVTETTTSHAIRVCVDRGPIQFRVGSTAGNDDIFFETTLTEGENSIAFVPNNASFWMEISAKRTYAALVDQVSVESAGALELPVPYAEADLRNIRYSQSGDVIYLACKGHQQYRIERRDYDSWSAVKYLTETGPFRRLNATNTTISVDAIVGEITLTASKNIFRDSNVGSLYRIESAGQVIDKDISADDTYTDPIRVTGVGEGRRFGYVISGNITGNTVTAQRSVGTDDNWVDMVTLGPWSGVDVDSSFLDDQDDAIIYYRLGVKPGFWPNPGTVSLALNFGAGSITGICRVTAVASEISATAIVLQSMGGLVASRDWYEGQWSPRRGYPAAVTIYEGRAWWMGADKINGSESDLYESFDDFITEDSGPISRTIGAGPVADVHWALPLGRLLIGTPRNSANVQPGEVNANAMLSGRSNSFDEPLTATNFNTKISNAKAIFVDRSGTRLYELALTAESSGYDDYASEDLSTLTPDLNKLGILHLAIQEKPDVRVHCVLSDGTASVLVFDRAENVSAWLKVVTDGLIEDISVESGMAEDRVYYHVNRSGVRNYEKWALEDECQGNAANKQADCFTHYSGAAATVITGLSHLNGKMVTVWADGLDVSSYDSNGVHIGPYVASGQLTLTTAASEVVVGLPYEARFKSNTLSSIQAMHPGEVRRIEQIQLSLYNTHVGGLRHGPDFEHMSDLPRVIGGAEVSADTILGIDNDFADKFFPFGGRYLADSRLCLTAASPRPATVLGCNAILDQHDKT